MRNILQFIQTDMAEKVGSKFIERMGGYVSMDTLIQGIKEEEEEEINKKYKEIKIKVYSCY